MPGEGKTLNLTFDRSSYSRGIYRANLLIDSWDKNHPLETKTVPLTLCIDTTTSVEWVDAVTPADFALLQNYPNPFNPRTTIPFAVHSPVHTTLRIYNVRGQLVKTLVDEEMETGRHSMLWDGRDDKGKQLASGIYFFKLTAGLYHQVQKMVLLR